MLSNLLNKISSLIRPARVTKASIGGQQFPRQQIEIFGKLADSTIVYHYGFFGNPPPDTVSLAFSVQGNPDNRVHIPLTNKDIPDHAEGEVLMFHPPTGAFLIFRKSGDIDIETGDGGSANVNVNAAQVNLGEGGEKIARIGDAVEVTIVGGSSAGTHTGTITSGGENTSI